MIEELIFKFSDLRSKIIKRIKEIQRPKKKELRVADPLELIQCNLICVPYLLIDELTNGQVSQCIFTEFINDKKYLTYFTPDSVLMGMISDCKSIYEQLNECIREELDIPIWMTCDISYPKILLGVANEKYKSGSHLNVRMEFNDVKSTQEVIDSIEELFNSNQVITVGD